MADMERFEARLAASLERLADEVPTQVDPQELTASIASTGTRRRWLALLFGRRGLQPTPALRVALVVVAILALAFGMLVLAQRIVPSPFDATVHGRMTCAGPSWATSAAETVVLDCTSELPDPRLAGPVRITLGAPATASAAFARFGSMWLDASGARWTGDLETMAAPSSMTAGDAVLVGEGGAAGLVLRFRLISANGLDWGLLGWIEKTR